MIFLWIAVGLIAAFLLFWGLIIGISYTKIAAAWAWQPKNIEKNLKRKERA